MAQTQKQEKSKAKRRPETIPRKPPKGFSQEGEGDESVEGREYEPDRPSGITQSATKMRPPKEY